jgi:hypothetical protein
LGLLPNRLVFVIVGTCAHDYQGMYRARRLSAAALTAVTSFCFGSLARAAPVALRFDAPSACPNEAEFIAAVTERGGRFDGPEALARVRGVDVEVTATGGGFTGVLRVESPAGASDHREVHDADCAEVVRGLGVVAAIALGSEGHGHADESHAPAATAAPETSAPRGLRSEAALPAEGKRRLRGGTFSQVDQVNVPAGTLRFDSDRAFSLAGGVDFGMFPGMVVPRWELAGSVANFITKPDGGTHLILPFTQLRGSLSAPATRVFDDYEMRVVAFRFGVDICDLVNYDSSGFVLSLCMELGGGFASLRTRSRAGRTEYKQKKEGGFAYAGLALDARYNVGSLLYVGLRVAGTGQFGSVSAERVDGSKLFETNWLGGYAVAGLGMHF